MKDAGDADQPNAEHSGSEDDKQSLALTLPDALNEDHKTEKDRQRREDHVSHAVLWLTQSIALAPGKIRESLVRSNTTLDRRLAFLGPDYAVPLLFERPAPSLRSAAARDLGGLGCMKAPLSESRGPHTNEKERQDRRLCA